MILKLIIGILIIISNATLYAEEFDICNDMVIDQITEMAFAQHGILYTGEVTCYRDKENTIIKSKRAFVNGKPIGRHVCYGKNNNQIRSISYNNTGVKKRGHNVQHYKDKYGTSMSSLLGTDNCQEDDKGACWSDRICKEGENCLFYCN